MIHLKTYEDNSKYEYTIDNVKNALQNERNRKEFQDKNKRLHNLVIKYIKWKRNDEYVELRSLSWHYMSINISYTSTEDEITDDFYSIEDYEILEFVDFLNNSDFIISKQKYNL